MSLKHGLMGILNYMPMTGYELDKAFEESLSFFWKASTSQVYRELTAMEECGWLVSELVIQDDRPNKKVYSITDEGRKELMNWMSSPEVDIEKAMSVKSGFLMRVFFAGIMDKKEALKLLEDYKKRCIEMSYAMGAAYESIAEYGNMVDDKEQTKFWKMTAMFGDDYFRLGIVWADKAIALLEES